MNTKILVCCHKNDIVAKEEPYFPIHVGKSLSELNLDIQGDDSGDNISEKNQSYCELTGMYWAWKNLKDIDYIGLCHYRRYFDFYGQCKSLFPYTIFKSKDFDKLKINIPSRIIKKLEQGRVIVPKPNSYRYPLYIDYCVNHNHSDIDILEKIIYENCDAKYKEAFKKVMYENNLLIHYNMFIMSKDRFDHYCEWLFGILSIAEKQIDISSYDPVQRRIYGYMAERLLNVYLLAEQLPIESLPVIWINDQEEKKSSKLFYALRYMMNKISLNMIKIR